MLGVFKRRWKPKRASNGGRLSVDACPPVTSGPECPVIGEKPRCVPVVPCARQVHPACEDRAHVLHAYDAYDVSVEHHNQHNNHITTSYQQPAYPLAPNICVEAGRIEFIKVPPDGGTILVETPPPPSPPPPLQPQQQQNNVQTVLPPATPVPPKYNNAKVTVTRAQQTSDEEKFDVAKESLEARIAELEEALEAAKITELRDKQTLMKLQKQLSKRESAARDVERERRLRAESEARVREAAADAARCRTRLKLLTHEFARMEETVRAMLVYKSRSEQLKQEKAALAVAFETRAQHYQSTIGRLNQEVSSLRQQLDISLCPSDGRVAALEADNAALTRDAEATRRQYERCLDDVANQVVRALLAQKNLREEITGLTRRIKDLESQNRALTTLLVHQLRGDSETDLSSKPQLALENSPKIECIPISTSTPEMQSRTDSNDHSSMLFTSPGADSTLKHCNSFNSDILNESSCTPEKEAVNEIIRRTHEKHLSADADILDTRLSLEDKKRHHILTQLWTELKGTEVTPQRLLEALSVVDSSLWVPPQRPVSLNLQLPVFQAAKCHRRSRPVLAQSNSKSEEETGNESPESGNRDEGYSTMSSDVQGEVNRVSGEPGRGGLEDLKEATDETDLADTTRIIVVEDQCDPDILYIPLNFAFGINPRNSFPPSKGILPFQHIMRSFSDSHLCLKITTAPSPCYSLSSPISSSPSILLLDISEKNCLNPLRRAKATTLLPSVEYPEEEAQSRISWCSGQDEHVHECATWDTEYVQQWLRLDESRTALQQHQRDLLELEYDRAELEDWSLSLSSEDVHEAVWKKSAEILTPGQISLSTLPSIQENNALELEEDSNECLWNSSSYMADKVGGELVALLMDTAISSHAEKRWPYAVNGNNHSLTLTSPGDDSWSSAETNSEDCFHAFEPETCSKRSSAALSGCSDDTNESHPVGTDFTRDFYRLVKFESTKSLASISSRSAAGYLPEHSDREQALQSVLTFIAEQQLYCNSRQECDSRPASVLREEQTKDFNIEGPPQNMEDVKDVSNVVVAVDCVGGELTTNAYDCCEKLTCENFSNENYVNFKQLRAELALNEQNSNKEQPPSSECIMMTMNNSVICDDTSFLNSTVQNCSLIESYSITDEDVVTVTLTNDSCDCNCTSDNTKNDDEIETDNIINSSSSNISNSDKEDAKMIVSDVDVVQCTEADREYLSPSSGGMTESQTSSVSTPDTIVSRIPRRQISRSSTPVKSSPKPSPTHSKKIPQPIPQTKPSAVTATATATATTTTTTTATSTTAMKSKIPSKDHRNTKPKSLKSVRQQTTTSKLKETSSKPIITSERLPACTSGLLGSSVIDGPPHRAVSFHERATSKDVIDELNRMIRKGGEEANGQQDAETIEKNARLDEACRPTGWIHVEKTVDLNDPKARASILDVMMASSDSSPTSSCGGSVSSESTDDPPDYGHLHRIHRFNRQKKESNSAPCTPITETAV